MGFEKIVFTQESKIFTLFVRNLSQFQYNIMHFGLNIATQHLQRYIYACRKELIKPKTTSMNLDSIIILAQSEEQPLSKLNSAFQVASKYCPMFNFFKCLFFKKSIKFLGCVVNNGKIPPLKT